MNVFLRKYLIWVVAFAGSLLGLGVAGGAVEPFNPELARSLYLSTLFVGGYLIAKAPIATKETKPFDLEH